MHRNPWTIPRMLAESHIGRDPEAGAATTGPPSCG
jgi:hypothetical protein